MAWINPKTGRVEDDGCNWHSNERVSRKSQTPCSVSAPTVRTDPAIEAIAKKLFGINSVPPLEQSKMIKRAAKAGAEALRKQNASMSVPNGQEDK